MVLQALQLVLGLIGLILGATLLLRGSLDLGHKLKIPKSVIGLFVVSLGTSLPELAVSIQSSLQQNSNILVSNLIGSNIFNLYFILGLSSLFTSFEISKKVLKQEVLFSLIVSFIPFLSILVLNKLNYIAGIALLVVWLLFMRFCWLQEQKNESKENTHRANTNGFLIPIYILTGCALLWFSSNISLESVVGLSRSLGVSESLIAFTVLAIGTSLPELITSLVALFKKEVTIALNNVIGSNILNLSFILAISLLINPLNLTSAIFKEFAIWLALQLIFINLVLVFTKFKISKAEGLLMILIYFGVLAWV